ncbi:MAG: hypothetical protein EBR91_05685, partial [Flavobacteriia bacterium]|nr:hypothetical protein [Flavobacteriia bacterium]
MAYSQRNELASKHPEAGKFFLEDKQGKKGTAKECIEKRDEFSKTYQYTDGTFTKQSSDFPMHYRGTDGAWYTYDKALNVRGDGKYKINKTDVPVSFDTKNGLVTMGYNKDGDVLRFGKETSYKVTDSQGIVLEETVSRDLSSVRFDKKENRISYENYWNGINRRIRFDLFEIETDYVLDHKPTNLSNDQFLHFTEVYQIPNGARIIEGVGENGSFGFKGELTLQGADGQDLILFNLPMCYDQTYFSDKYGEPVRPILGEYVYQIIGNELHLTTVVPASWVLDDARVFPLVIDPTASSFQGGTYPFERYNYGCSYTLGVNVPAGTITGWYAQWQVTATGGGYMSEGLSQIGYNAAYQGQFQGNGWNGGTYNVNTPVYTGNNGVWGGGTMTFWWRGYRTWGSACCCNTSYQRRNYLYVYVDYNSTPADPSAANTNINPVCNPGQTITLTASNPVGTVYWYSGGCGSNFIGTGTSINVNPNATTTYFARNYANGQFSNGCASITVNVPGTPAAPAANAVSIFCGQTASLSASGNGSITWYANSNATGQLGTGANYTTPVLNATTTYYVNQAVSGCTSASTAVTVTANTPSNPTANNVSINCGQTASLSASSNGGMIWYSNANGTGQLATGGNYTTPALSQTTTYYVQAGAAGCVSQITPVTVTVNGLTAPTANAAAVNCGQTAALTAQGGTGSGYTWFTNANGTGQVGTGASFTPPVLGATTTYYVASTAGMGGGNAQNFSFTGGVQTYTVPAGVTQLTVDARGAGGGVGPGGGAQAGTGGRIQGTISVSPGQVLTIVVGGAGGNSQYNRSGSGGGGFTGILDAGGNHLISAGGGGGSAGNEGCPQVGSGGNGGSTSGTNGSCGVGGSGGSNAAGAAGGVGGTGSISGQAGTSNGGGNGGATTNDQGTGGGGGGFGVTAGASQYGSCGGWSGAGGFGGG